MFPQPNPNSRDAACPHIGALLDRLGAAGITYQRVSLAAALRSAEPLFIYSPEGTPKC